MDGLQVMFILGKRLDRHAVKSGVRVRPGAVGCLPASGCQAEVFSGLSFLIVVLEGGRLLFAGELHTADPLQVGEIDDEGMIVATGLIRHTAEVLPGQSLDVFGIYGALFAPRLFLFVSSGFIRCFCAHEGIFIVIEDIRLGCADSGIDSGSIVRPVSQEVFADEPAAAEGTQETTAFRT